MGRILRDQELAKFQNKSKVLRIWESLRGNSPKFIEAEKTMKRALQLQEQVLHSKHPDIAITLHELGMLMVRKKDYESAETLFRRSLDIQLDTWGERHPYTATCLNNLGNTLYRLHRNSEALSFASRCLDIRMAILGPNHPENMSVRQDLKIIRGENFF
jgi:tetratricopeptide (TPR) repeat protein